MKTQTHSLRFYGLMLILSACTTGMQAQGDVGIGTSAPAARLHIASNSTVNHPQLMLNEDDNDYARLMFKNNTASKTWSAAAYPSDVDSLAYFNIYNSSSGNLLVVNGKGKLGIATTPAYPLSMNNNLGDKIALWGGGGYGAHFGFGIQTSLLQIHTAYVNDDVAFGYGSSGSFTETMRVKGNGKVGIGTNAPDSRLHVAAGSSGMDPNPSSVATFENAASSYINIISEAETGVLFGANGNATNGGIIYNTINVPNGLLFRTNNNVNRMVITAEGNVGIGGFVPAFPLSFLSTLGDKIALWGTDPGSHFGFGIQTSLLQIHSANANDDIAFGYGGSGAFTESARITGDGKVGIGTPDPTATLDVNGFTKLGSNAPKIRMIKLTGTTSATEGTSVSISHGLPDISKILSIEVLVVTAGQNCIHQSYVVSPGYEFNFLVNSSSVVVQNLAANSAYILSKAIRILIIYEE